MARESCVSADLAIVHIAFEIPVSQREFDGVVFIDGVDDPGYAGCENGSGFGRGTSSGTFSGCLVRRLVESGRMLMVK